MNRLLVGFCAVALAAGCSKKGDEDPNTSELKAKEVLEPATPTNVAPPPAIQTAPSKTVERAPYEIVGEATAVQGLAAATAGAKTLGGSLKSRLMSAMQEGGPEGALEACATEASSLTAGVGNKRLRVGRSTLRLRNPKNAEAPDWVKSWLVETGERKAEGVAGVEEVVDGTARILIPLATGGLCLTCHGNTKSNSETMQALLASRYPGDKATGYEVGDLRGALWAEFDLKP
jgi:hypothetical protein